MSGRPDVIAAQQRLVAADHRFGSAKAALLPAIRLGATAGFQGRADPFGFLDNFVGNLLAGLTAPLWQGGRLRAQKDAEQAATRDLLGLVDDVGNMEGVRRVAEALDRKADGVGWDAPNDRRIGDDFEKLRENVKRGWGAFIRVPSYGTGWDFVLDVEDLEEELEDLLQRRVDARGLLQQVARAALAQPGLSLRVVSAIYWQALRLKASANWITTKPFSALKSPPINLTEGG